MTEVLVVVYMLVGFARARHYARWFYDDGDDIGVGVAWVFGSFIWPAIDALLLARKGVLAVPGDLWKTLFVANDPKPVRKERELEKRRARVRELEKELEL